MRTQQEPSGTSALNQVVVSDLWQQQAVAALRAGQDVVVHAPTGAGNGIVPADCNLWTMRGNSPSPRPSP